MFAMAVVDRGAAGPEAAEATVPPSAPNPAASCADDAGPAHCTRSFDSIRPNPAAGVVSLKPLKFSSRFVRVPRTCSPALPTVVRYPQDAHSHWFTRSKLSSVDRKGDSQVAGPVLRRRSPF
jgi:hypothetical protein